MNRNFDLPQIDYQWANERETHPAVAAAIHAISDSTRSPQAIWEAPTRAEVDAVKSAVEEYLIHGDFPKEEDGIYPWGQGAIEIHNPRLLEE